MMKTSHVAIGTLGALVINQQLGLPVWPLLAGVSLGSILPDFDLLLGIRHRGITHWLVWPILLWLCIPLLPVFQLGIYQGVAIGWILHILADCLTVEGLRPLWPAQIWLHGPVITGKSSEYLLVLPALMALLYRMIL